MRQRKIASRMTPPGRTRARQRLPLLLCSVLAFCGLTRASRAADEIGPAVQQARASFAASLEELAKWCDANGLPPEAAKTRAWCGPRDPYKFYLAQLPKLIGPPPPPPDASPQAIEWHARFQRLRQDQANTLYELARKAIRAQRASLGYELALNAVRENPDHEALRKLMGYQKFKDQWCTPYEFRKLRAGQAWTNRFGWLPAAQATRYEQGQRFSQGKWVSAEEDARQHRSIDNGWQVETEHYNIVTNHSLETGVALGVKLEKLYRVWQQLFVRFYATQAQVLAMFDGRRPTPTETPRHQVVLFRAKEEYQQALRPRFPNIEITVGAYVAQTKRAYFFVDNPQDDRTLFHEATHQLFHESRPVPKDVGLRCNFWVIEGIAMFMESLHDEDGFHVLGGLEDERLVAARYRLLHDNFYIPLANFTGYGMERLQKDKNVATLYSQAAGLTHFFIYSDAGEHRDSLVAYLSTVYSGRDEPDTLARLVGKPYPELDRQYRRFMQESLKHLPATPEVQPEPKPQPAATPQPKRSSPNPTTRSNQGRR